MAIIACCFSLGPFTVLLPLRFLADENTRNPDTRPSSAPPLSLKVASLAAVSEQPPLVANKTDLGACVPCTAFFFSQRQLVKTFCRTPRRATKSVLRGEVVQLARTCWCSACDPA
ncbi:hypothetical protein L917_07576 [Phytophthora nicotianae]|uniref:Secreted protein n=3 Tax=Phytophthora nicotianae TaxID=4792 RepID=V9FA28_PHYNI|nr:hypothetical protein F443_07930 [Phytophthora nicotianae P1569]ETL94426.1 hypothetical protein L917_07576 [Phytophthora nicotianae]ETO76640.1 hypothetical protein F444_07978 [Phytophthora nicotianae P1976]